MPKSSIAKTIAGDFIIMKKLSTAKLSNTSCVINIILCSDSNTMAMNKIPDITCQGIYWKTNDTVNTIDDNITGIIQELDASCEILEKIQKDDSIFLQSDNKTTLTTYVVENKSVKIYRTKIMKRGVETGSMAGFVMQ